MKPWSPIQPRAPGIELPVISSFGIRALVRPGVLFGFASFAEKTIRSTVHRLGEALRSPEPNYRPALPVALSAPGAEKPRFFDALFRP